MHKHLCAELAGRTPARRCTRPSGSALLLSLCALTGVTRAQPCPGVWQSTERPGGLDGESFAGVVLDDGTGEALYVAGEFRYAGGVVVNGIARWDSNGWSHLDGGLTSWSNEQGEGRALLVWDPDQSGPAGPGIVVGGAFRAAGTVDASNIAFWNGAEWSPIGDGLQGEVRCLVEFDDDADGPRPAALFAGGVVFVNGAPANGLARWSGEEWSIAGGGLWREGGYYPSSLALAVFDEDGPGPRAPALFVGGEFDRAGETDTKGIARWDGATWTAVAGGLARAPGTSTFFGPLGCALQVFDPDGPGPAAPVLAVGGRFEHAGSVATRAMASWDGVAWSPMGAIVTGSSGWVKALTTWDRDGAGPTHPRLCAGGFALAFPTGQQSCAFEWDGTQWLRIADGARFGSAAALVTYDATGNGARSLVALGDIETVSDSPGGNAAIVSGSGAWRAFERPLDGPVRAILPSGAAAQTGNPEPTFVGGSFTSAGPAGTAGIASWDGDRWRSVGGGMSGPVYTIAHAPPDAEVGGAELIAAGAFTGAGEVAAKRVAAWDGEQWSALGAGFNADVLALAFFDSDGDGGAPPRLFAGGAFTFAEELPTKFIAQWDGARWLPVGAPGNFPVRALAVFDADGPGPQLPSLYAGGDFTQIGGVPAARIARWNGAAWSTLPNGLTGRVSALAVARIGGHESLIVGGAFQGLIGGGPQGLTRIAAWNGAGWAPLALGLDGPVHCLAIVPTPGSLDGDAELFAGGEFLGAVGGLACAHLASWSGSAWNPVDSGADSTVRALAVGAGSSRPLFVGGEFATANGVASPFFATRGLCATQGAPCPGDATNDNRVDFLDLSLVLDQYGVAFPLPGPDLNLDGVVNFLDLNIVLSNFGQAC